MSDPALQSVVVTWNTDGFLPPVVQGAAFSLQLSATNAVSFELASGQALPPGLTLGGEGLLSGNPTAPGEYGWTVVATGPSTGGPLYPTTTLEFDLTVIPLPVWLTHSVVPADAVTAAFDLQLTATYASSFALSGGALPGGLNLTASGVLSGVLTTPGNFTWQVTAIGSVAGAVSSEVFTMTVYPLPVWVTVGAQPDVAEGAPYSLQLDALTAVSYAVTAGVLPTGLSMSSSGLISGAPTSSATWNWVVTATGGVSDAVATLSMQLVVATRPVWVTASTLTSTAVNVACSYALVATYALDVVLITGGLPTGLTLSPAGALSGTPSVAGAYSWTLRAYSQGSVNIYADRAFALTVAALPVWVTPSGALANTAAGQPYSVALVATNGVSYAVTSGALPTGISLSSAGVLSGTPAAGWSWTAPSNFTVTATGAALNATASRNFSLLICEVPVWQTSGVLAPQPNLFPYSLQLSAIGGVTYAVTAGALPPGITLSSAGLLSGTFASSVATAYSWTVTATGYAANAEASQAFSLWVAMPAWVTVGALTPIPTGVFYTLQLLATYASSYAVTAGSLPPGLTLTAAGALSGTPTTAGSYTWTVTATGPAATPAIMTEVFTLQIANQPAWSTASTLTNWAVSSAYSQALVATNAASYAVTSGTLPTGLGLSSGGVLAGTPTAAGSWTWVVTATGAAANIWTAQTFTLVTAAVPVWQAPTGTLTNIAVGTPYTLQLGATNALSYAVTAGYALPPGLSLGASTALLSGTPTTANSYSWSVTATGNAANALQTQTFSLVVAPVPVWVTAGGLTSWAAGTAYSVTLSATNALTYAVTSGTLPTGIGLSNAGVLSGTPSVAGQYYWTVTATGNAATAVAAQSFSLLIAAVPVWTTSGALANWVAGAPYSLQLITSTGASTSFAVSGSLPAGMALSSTGLLSGTPTTAGTPTWSIVATGLATNATASRAFSITIAGALTWVPQNGGALTSSAVSAAYSLQLVCTNASSYAITSGAVPGLTLSGSGLLSGTPSAAGSYAFTVTATANATVNATAAQAFTLLIAAIPSFTTAGALTASAVGIPYSVPIAVSNATSYAVTSGSLPAGLALSATTGLLSGTPTTAVVGGPFTITATGAATNATQQQAFTLTISPVPVWSATGVLGSASVGTGYSTTVSATNGVTYAVTSGTLPTGLALSTGGVLSGTPTAAGSWTWTIAATGTATNAVARRAFSLVTA